MKRQQPKVENWVKALTAEQMRGVLIELVMDAIDGEMVAFPTLAPYWTATGDPLIAGQKTHPDD